MTAKVFRLVHEQAINNAIAYIRNAAHGMVVKISEPNRSLDQNATQWPILKAFSEQLQWPVNGQMIKMSEDEWKDVLTAAFRKESLRMAMGLDGGMVMLGMRTSQMSKRDFSEYIEFLYATAADRGVVVHRAERE
jgi:hypothetical protein